MIHISVNLFFTLLFCATGHTALSAPAVLKLARQAADAQGRDYLAARDELVKIGNNDKAALKSVMTGSDDWRIQTVVAIAMERSEKPEAIAKLLQWKPDGTIPDLQSLSGRAGAHAMVLKTKSGDIPLILVEKVWKGNELDFSLGKDYDIACAAMILGFLGTPEARRPLEMLLDREEFDIRVAAAIALKHIKKPESVPVLLDYLVKGTYRETEDISYAYVSDAIAECATKEFIPLFKETLAKIDKGEIKDDPNFRYTLTKLIAAYEK